ncbi:hypothetical protein JCM10450v2_006493 [Rhodotorula kratochvilovae]
MPSRSSRRSARRADSSDELGHLDSPPRSAHAPPADSSSESSSSDEDDAALDARKAWDVEQGYGTGEKRWEMRSLPAGRAGMGMGGAAPGDAPEPGVRASTKAPGSRAQGSYAPVAQADPSSRSAQRGSGGSGGGAAGYSDPEQSPPYSDSEGEQRSPPPSGSEDEKPRSGRSSRSGKKQGAATAGDPADEQPKGGMTRKRWIIIGVLAALIVTIISKKSNDSESSSGSAEDNASSSHSKSSSTSSGSKSASASASSSGNSTGTAQSGSSLTSATGLMSVDDEMTLLAANGTGNHGSPTSAPVAGGLSGSSPTLAAATGMMSLPVVSLPSIYTDIETFGDTTNVLTFGGQPAATPSSGGPAVNSPSPALQSAGFPSPSSAFVKPAASSRVIGLVGGTTFGAAAPLQTGGGSNAGWTGATQTSSSAEQDTVTKVSTTATWFSADQHLSACKTTFADSDYIAAIPPAMFGSDGSTASQLCGAKLHVWQPESNQTITVAVGDVCNECPTSTAIDLSQSAFLAVAPGGADDPAAALEVGVLSVQWFFDDARDEARLGGGFEAWSAGVSAAPRA